MFYTFGEWWAEFGKDLFGEDEKWKLEVAWQAAANTEKERAAMIVDEELTDFLNEAPPGHYDNRLAETVDFLRGVLMDAIRKG